MFRRSLLAALATAAIAAVPAPAHASSLGQVTLNMNYQSVVVGTSWTTVVVCEAVATTTEPDVVAVATEVDCAFGPDSRSGALPGAVAVMAVASAATPPATACVSGRAEFLDTVTKTVFGVTAGPVCRTVG